jgi:hypothetical protein
MPAGSPGSPSDALSAIADSAAAEAKRIEAGRPDPLVSVAFALGWQMAEIYNPDSVEDDDAGRRYWRAEDHDLPGLSRLRPEEWEAIGLYQVEAGITQLHEPIRHAGLLVPNAQHFADRIRPLPEDERRIAIREFHVRLLSTFTAADYRLGKAYGLGRALADTTRDPARWRDELRQGRVDALAAWTRDLATAFPPHAGHAVARSLQAWGAWAARGEDLDDASERQLTAEGRLWRSLLSGEKRAADTLNTASYVTAAEHMLTATRELAVRVASKYRWVLIGAAVLVAAGVAVMFIFGGAAAIVTGVSTILGAVGLTWKGAGTSIGTSAAGAETPLWGAALDTVIYERITPQHIVDGYVPPAQERVDEPSLVAARRGSSAAR